MSNQLKNPEYETAESIINEAFNNSAKALQRFIGKKVETQTEIWNVNNLKNPTVSANDNFVLISDIKGDLKGKCYLVFTHEEANKLFKNCLSNKYVDNETMQNAILLELDNILTAAVVTVFSDKLKINIYAYVPHLIKMSNAVLDQNLASDAKLSKLVMNFRTTFKIEEITLSPTFFWAVESKFLEHVSTSLN